MQPHFGADVTDARRSGQCRDHFQIFWPLYYLWLDIGLWSAVSGFEPTEDKASDRDSRNRSGSRNERMRHHRCAVWRWIARA